MSLLSRRLLQERNTSTGHLEAQTSNAKTRAISLATGWGPRCQNQTRPSSLLAAVSDWFASVPEHPARAVLIGFVAIRHPG